MLASNQTFQRERNKALVLQSIFESRQISRVYLSQLTGLKKSSITNICNELLDESLIVEGETGTSGSSGGRKPIYLSINGFHSYFVGISLHPNSYNVVVMDLAGQIVQQKNKVSINIDLNDSNSFDHEVSTLIQNEYHNLSLSGYKIRAFMIGMPGYVDPFERIIRRSESFNLNVHPFTPVNNDAMLSISFENDAKCCTWAELLHKNPSNLGDFLSVLIDIPQGKSGGRQIQDGIAIGIGLFLNGNVYYGRDGRVGEFRSFAWKPGNKSQFSVSDEDIPREGLEPDIFLAIMREIDQNLVPIASVLSPERMILFGDGAEMLHTMILSSDSHLESAFKVLHLPPMRVELSCIHDNAIAIGAASKLLCQLYNPQRVQLRTHPGAPNWDSLLKINPK